MADDLNHGAPDDTPPGWRVVTAPDDLKAEQIGDPELLDWLKSIQYAGVIPDWRTLPDEDDDD